MAKLKTHSPVYYIKDTIENGILDKHSAEYTFNIWYVPCFQISLYHVDNEIMQCAN